MNARLAAVALVVSAALLDAAGAHGLAGFALVAAVPAAGVAGLQALADALVQSSRIAQVQVVPAAIALVLIVAAAAVRAPLTGAEEPPSAATLALGGALAAFALQALLGGVALLGRQRRVSNPSGRLASPRL